jgi:multicomponent Na+:H+ antiporter subunit B
LPFLYNDTIKHYIEQTKDFLQFPNIVTAIIISFRGYDTLIETIVILTAGISVTSILSQNKSIQQITKSILYDKSIISNVVMLILPFIILFAFYIQAHGEESPGGGFQSGSILATAIIGYSITISEDLIRKYLTNSLLMRIGTIGVLLYFTVGLIPIFKGQNFLNHNYVTCGATNLISECHSSSQKISIFISELGVGMTVFAVMTIIFFNLKSEKKYE